MKAVVCEKQGLENLSLKTVDIPEPKGQYDVVFQVISSALNPVDYQKCTWPGKGFLNFEYPIIPGLDSVGVVHSLGKSVDASRFVAGKTVVLVFGSLARSEGACAQYYVHDSRYLSIVPESALAKFKDLKEAATQLSAVPCAGYTAYQIVAIQLGFPLFKQEKLISNLRKIRSVVVTAGAGGVGNYCLQLLNIYRNNLDEKERAEFQIIATCSAKNFDFVVKSGATDVIDYTKENIVERVKEITKGVGAEAWIDLVGKESVNQGIDSISHGGQIVVVVDNADYTDKLFVKSLTIHNVLLGTAYYSGIESRSLEMVTMGDLFIQWVADRQIVTEIEVINLDQVIEGLHRLQKSQVRGKLVLNL